MIRRGGRLKYREDGNPCFRSAAAVRWQAKSGTRTPPRDSGDTVQPNAPSPPLLSSFSAAIRSEPQANPADDGQMIAQRPAIRRDREKVEGIFFSG